MGLSIGYEKDVTSFQTLKAEVETMNHFQKFSFQNTVLPMLFKFSLRMFCLQGLNFQNSYIIHFCCLTLYVVREFAGTPS